MALILLQVREKRAVTVLLVDLMDASGSFLPRVRDLVGRNPVVLVGTKVHTIPALSDCMLMGANAPLAGGIAQTRSSSGEGLWMRMTWSVLTHWLVWQGSSSAFQEEEN